MLIYWAGLGLAGSAIGTLIAQLGMRPAFARRLLAVPGARRRPDLSRMLPLLRTGWHITVRTVSLLAAFTLASALAARLGAAAPAAHQITFSCSCSLRSCWTRSPSPVRSWLPDCSAAAM